MTTSNGQKNKELRKRAFDARATAQRGRNIRAQRVACARSDTQQGARRACMVYGGAPSARGLRRLALDTHWGAPWDPLDPWRAAYYGAAWTQHTRAARGLCARPDTQQGARRACMVDGGAPKTRLFQSYL